MAIKKNITEEFLQGVKDIEEVFFNMGYNQLSYLEKGYACYVQYKNKDCIVEFIFGPPEYQIEILIYVAKEKYAFKDLLRIPAIENWVRINRYVQGDKRKLKNELLWFVDLLKFALPNVCLD